jgi:hypothetical protein
MDNQVVLVVGDQVVQHLVEVLETRHQQHHHKVIMVVEEILAAAVVAAVQVLQVLLELQLLEVPVEMV